MQVLIGSHRDASFAVLERPFLVLSVSGSVKGHGVR